MMSVAHGGQLTLWLFVIITVVSITKAMPWSGATSHMPKMDGFFPPIAMGDFMPDNQKFNNSLAKKYDSKLGGAALEFMMKKTLEMQGKKCDSDATGDSTFCLCMPSMPADQCTDLTADTIITQLKKVDCPEMLNVAANKKDNCIVGSLSEKMKTQTKEDFKTTWRDLGAYQHTMVSFMPKNLDFSPSELTNIIQETDEEAKCDNRFGEMVKTNLKKSETDVPMDLIAFASSDKLKSQVQKATSDEKKSMLRQIRKFKESCLEIKMPEIMEKKPDMQELQLRKPDVATIMTCNAITSGDKLTLDSVDDLADNLTCSLYDDPEKLSGVCDMLTDLSIEDIEEALDQKPQLCLLHTKCKDMGKPIKLNRHTMKCLSPKEISGQVSNAKTLSSFTKLSQVACSSKGMKREQMEILTKGMKPFLSTISQDEVPKFDCLMKFLPIDELSSAQFMNSDDDKKSFCQTMATLDQSQVNATQLRQMSNFCKQAQIPLQQQDELLRNIQPEDINDLSSDDMLQSPQMVHFICNKEVLNTMVDKLKASYGTNLENMDPGSLSAMLPVLLGMDEPTECLPIYSSNYAEFLAALKRIIGSCTDEIVDVAKARLTTIINLCEQSAVDAMKDGGRVKRDIGKPQLSCSDLPTGVDMVDMSANLFSQLSCDVFTPDSDCLTQIATVDGYSSEQLRALSAKLSQCEIWKNTDLIPKLCVLMLTLTSDTVTQVALTSANGIQCAGSKIHTEITSQQLEPLFNKYKTDNEIASTSDLTKEQVGEMGILFCGIPVSEISSFSQYKNMSPVIDAYPCFSEEQLVALATKEQEEFSDSPDPASLGRIFYVTAGLPESTFNSFTAEHIRNIPDVVFSRMSDTSLNAIPLSAYCGLSKDQASYISNDLVETLLSDQKNIINNIKSDQKPDICDDSGSDDDSGSNNPGSGGSGSGDNNDGSGDNTGSGGKGSGDNTGGSGSNTGSGGSGSGDNTGGSGGSNTGSGGSGSGDNTGGSGGSNTGSGGSGSGDNTGGSGGSNMGSGGSGSGDNTGGSGGSNMGSGGSGIGDNTGGSGGSNMGSGGSGIGDNTGGSGGSNMGSGGSGIGDNTGGSGGSNMGSGGSGSGDITGGSGGGNMGPGGSGIGDHTGGSGGGNMGPGGSGSGDNTGGMGGGNMKPGDSSMINDHKDKAPRLDLGEIEEYKQPPSSYDFMRHSEKLSNLTADKLSSVDLKRVPTSSIKELDDDSILEVAKEICDSSDHDKKAFIKTKIESMYSKLDGEQKKSIMGCVPSDSIKSTNIVDLLPLMKDGSFGRNTPQAQIMAEKTTEALKNSLAGNEGPSPEELLKSAGSVICLMPTEVFKKAIDAVKDKPVLLKGLMMNYTKNCGDRDPSRAKVIAETLGKNVDLNNKTVDELKNEMKTNTQSVCSASDDLKNIDADVSLLQTAMTSCNGTREELATRASTSYTNLQKYFTKIDTVSTEWQNKLRKNNWKNVDVKETGILDYFIPLLKSDYENITKEKVCSSSDLPDVLGYPQVSKGAMIYQFCKDVHKTDFSKFKQLGIHAPSADIKKYAKAEDVQNLKKAIYMVPKAKFDALCEVSNKAFNPTDSSTFSKSQYTLIGLDMMKMNKTKEEDRGMLCDMMACNAITALSPEDIEEKLTFCKQYLSWENFLCAHSPSIKEQFMIPASGLSMKTINKLNITCEDVDDNLVGLAATITSCDVRNWLYGCSKQNGRKFEDTADLEIYSQLIDQMTDEDFGKIADQKKCSMWEDVIREETKRRTDLIDFRLNMNSLMNHSSCYGVNNTVTKQRIAAMKESCAKNNRKKRESSGMTCSEFLSYGNNRAYLVSAQDISSMDKTEFEDCVVDIGSTAGFESAHWQAAAEQAKQLYGDVSTWTSGTLKNLGGITSGLSVDDLKKLDLSDLEAASVVGTSGSWDNDKLTTAYAEFKKDYLDDQASNTNSTHLAAIGELNCGATNEDIQNINAIAYCDAADKVGSLQKCEAIQKQAYAKLAKDPVCFGDDIAGWSPDVIRVLGVQIGGLEHDDISILSGDQLLEIDRLAMGQIPPNIINAFSLEQLQMFDSDQVSVLSPEQMQSLDPEKRTIVEEKSQSTSDSDNDKGDDAPIIEASLLLLFTMLMASLLRI